MKKISLTLLSLLALASLNATADVASAQKFADKYAVIAKHIDPAFAGPSAEEGKAFFNRELLIKGKPTACASCHTANPAASDSADRIRGGLGRQPGCRVDAGDL